MRNRETTWTELLIISVLALLGLLCLAGVYRWQASSFRDDCAARGGHTVASSQTIGGRGGQTLTCVGADGQLIDVDN